MIIPKTFLEKTLHLKTSQNRKTSKGTLIQEYDSTRSILCLQGWAFWVIIPLSFPPHSLQVAWKQEKLEVF